MTARQTTMFEATPYGGIRIHGSQPPLTWAIGQGGHDNSREAYHAPRAEAARSERLNRIIGWLLAYGPATDREIAHGLGFSDLNAVRPRITEGLAAVPPLLVEVGNVRCAVTGKTVRVVSVAGARP